MASDPASSRNHPDAIHRPHWLRTALIALGLTNIAAYWMAAPIVSPLHLAVYHWSGPAFGLFAPVWLNLIVTWIVLAAVLTSTRLNRRWRRAVWVGILVTLPAVVAVSYKPEINNSELALGMGSPNHFHFLYLWLYGLSPLMWIALMVFWRPQFDRNFDRVLRFGEVVLMFSGVAGVVLLAQLAWFNWAAAGMNDQRPSHVHATAQAAKPRILWVVMDELSYQQVYEQRFPGLALPAFDELSAESNVFTQVIPAGLYTERILPSLISGQPVAEVRATAAGQLSTREQSSSKWRSYNQYDTVFQDALRNGYGTGVIGWWNPYCRILPAVLDHCHWTAWFLEHKRLSEDAGPSARLKAVLGRAINEAGKILPNRLNANLETFDPADKQHAAQTYLNLSQNADDLLKDPSANFVLVHISIPHPVGIYNRATGKLSAEPTSYIDNLALCDLYLAHLRSELEERGEWDSTTLVLMGDHGWRTQLWRPGEWDEIDEAASHGGQFDPRPGYIVKLPNQHEGARINEPFHALETRVLFDVLMSGQIQTTQDLEAWVRAHP